VGNALLEGYAVGLVGFTAVFAILLLASFATGGNEVLMVLLLTAGVLVILALAVVWNSAKKKL
jgi:hypothetical protein